MRLYGPNDQLLPRKAAGFVATPVMVRDEPGSAVADCIGFAQPWGEDECLEFCEGAD